MKKAVVKKRAAGGKKSLVKKVAAASRKYRVTKYDKENENEDNISIY